MLRSQQHYDAPNKVWAVDFRLDATTDGPIKIVSIVDEHTRECLGGLFDRAITGEDLIDETEPHRRAWLPDCAALATTTQNWPAPR